MKRLPLPYLPYLETIKIMTIAIKETAIAIKETAIAFFKWSYALLKDASIINSIEDNKISENNNKETKFFLKCCLSIVFFVAIFVIALVILV